MPSGALQLHPYSTDQVGLWDAVVDAAPGGTILHSRRFLDYHGDRFRDFSLLATRAGEISPSMVFPLAADPAEPDRVVSHPGSSFGGIVGAARDPVHHRNFLVTAAKWLRGQGFGRLLYRCTPHGLLRQPDDGLLPDLLRLGPGRAGGLVVLVAAARYCQRPSLLAIGDPPGRTQGADRPRRETAEDWALLHGVISGRLRKNTVARRFIRWPS